jgi:hypothetical protein
VLLKIVKSLGGLFGKLKAPFGNYKGLEILQNEQNDGLAVLNELLEAQRKQAILNFSKTGNNNLTEAFKDNVVID